MTQLLKKHLFIFLHGSVLLTACFFFIYAPAQDTDYTQLNLSRTVYFPLYDFQFTDSPALQRPDTSLVRLQVINPVMRFGYFKSLGIIGSAHQSLVFADEPYAGFRYRKNNFDLYFTPLSGLRFFDTRAPYSEIFFGLGGKEEVLNITHSQNIKNTDNFGVHYSRYAGEGLYASQKTQSNAIAAYNRYQTQNRRYAILTAFGWSNLDLEENGGIANDTLFEEFTGLQKSLLGTRIQEARQRHREKNAMVTHYLNFGKTVFYPDSVPDSLRKKTIIPTFRILHTVNYQILSSSYEDLNPDSAFYAGLYSVNDTIPLFDTSAVRFFENAVDMILFNHPKTGNPKMVLRAGTSYQHFLLKQNGRDTLFTGMMTRASIASGISNKFSGSIGINYTMSGVNSGDFLSTGILNGTFLNTALILSFDWKRQLPFFYDRFLYNPQIQWVNDFRKVDVVTGKLGFSSKKFHVSSEGGINSIKHPIYYSNAGSKTIQAIGTIQIVFLKLDKDFHWKKWHLLNHVTFQDVSRDDVVRVPKWIVRQTGYFESHLFKNALWAQIGLDFFYFAKFYSDAYMPFSGQFYQQNEKKIGDYPFFDFFIVLKIKTARVFFKVEHFNSGLSGNDYYIAPHYPAPDRVFRLGINWMMYE